MKLKLVSFALILAMLSLGDSKTLLDYTSLDPSDIATISSSLARAEPRQLGLIGLTALGAIMYPILVSLGMTTFVSHLPTVFDEFASEFGIPSTAPKRGFFFQRRKRYDIQGDHQDRWQDILKVFHSNLVKTLEKTNVYHKNVQRF